MVFLNICSKKEVSLADLKELCVDINGTWYDLEIQVEMEDTDGGCLAIVNDVSIDTNGFNEETTKKINDALDGHYKSLIYVYASVGNEINEIGGKIIVEIMNRFDGYISSNIECLSEQVIVTIHKTRMINVDF
jgi:hypothetical protein